MDGLGRLGGAHDIQVDLATGWVTLRCGPDEAVDLASVPRAIRDAGFEPTALQLRAQGTFVDTPAPAFRIDGWARALPVASFDRASATAPSGLARIDARVNGWEEHGPVFLVLELP